MSDPAPTWFAVDYEHDHRVAEHEHERKMTAFDDSNPQASPNPTAEAGYTRLDSLLKTTRGNASIPPFGKPFFPQSQTNTKAKLRSEKDRCGHSVISIITFVGFLAMIRSLAGRLPCLPK